MEELPPSYETESSKLTKGFKLLSPLLQLKSEAANYSKVRKELLLLEAKEASSHLSKTALFYMVSLIAGLLFYLLLIASIIGFSSVAFTKSSIGNKYPELSWEPMTAILALVHLFILLIFLLFAKRKPQHGPLFGESLNELKKEQSWLKKKKSH